VVRGGLWLTGVVGLINCGSGGLWLMGVWWPGIAIC
jgi:hypothetical protein